MTDLYERVERERVERIAKLRTLTTSELIEKIVDYKIWAASGEASWAPCSRSDVDEMSDIINERIPSKP